MKKFIPFPIFLCFVLSGCIQTPEPDVPRRINLLYNVENVGDTLTVGQDSIAVSEVKLLAGKMNVILIDNSILQTALDAIVMTYRNQFDGQDEVIVSTNIGFEDFDQFKGMKLFINPPVDGADILDNDFFGQGQESNFSFIFRGTYNGKDFTYKSSPGFEKDFPFGQNIELTDEKESLVIRIHYDMRDIIVDQSENRILDPENPENKSRIDSLLRELIAVEAFAADAL